MFETSYYNSRYFNKVLRFGDIVIKSSDNIEKIKSEYDYYYYLPNSHKRFFVQPFDLEIKNGIASYKMDFVNYKNIAEYSQTNKLLPADLNAILSTIDSFKSIYKKTSKEKVYDQSKYLVIEKTKNRIKDNSEYQDLFKRICKAFDNLYQDRETFNVTISHGDLCFSNMLWSGESKIVKFVDPRGAKKKSDIYMDEYYDLSKIRHSLVNGYENVIYSQDIEYSQLYETFEEYLLDKKVSLKLLKVYEASLFLSMVPLHIDSQKNIKSFINISNKLLEEIDY